MTTDVLPPAAAPVTYKDRGAGLVLFGVLHVLIGALCALMLLATAAASERSAQRGAPAVPMLAQTLLVYAFFTFYFVVIGIGSIRARRWARAVALAVSWVWLVIGVASVASLFFTIPRMLVFIPPWEARLVVTMMITASVVFYLIVPAAFILFYRSPHVAATCAARDPKPRWTDRAPVPVLAVSLMLAFAALMLVGMLARPVVPLLGTILTGAPAMIVILGLAALLAVISVQFFRLRRSAWWTLMLLQVAGGIVSVVTFSRLDINAYYGAVGVPMTPQMKVLHLERLFRDPLLWTVMIAVWIGYVALLVWMRKYFTGAVPRTRAGDVTI
jgi:hypothetical protein